MRPVTNEGIKAQNLYYSTEIQIQPPGEPQEHRLGEVLGKGKACKHPCPLTVSKEGSQADV